MSQPPSTFLKTAAISNLAQLRKGDSATVIGLADDEGSAATFMKSSDSHRENAFMFMPKPFLAKTRWQSE